MLDKSFLRLTALFLSLIAISFVVLIVADNVSNPSSTPVSNLAVPR